MHQSSAGSEDFNCIDSVEAQPRGQGDSYQDEATATIYQDTAGKPVIVAVEHNILANNVTEDPDSPTGSSVQLPSDSAPGIKTDMDSEVLPFAQPVLPMFTATAAPVEEVTMPTDGVNPADERKKGAKKDEDHMLSSSMQSLVDGLMTWGGQFEGEDVLALPTGMAASIAFETSDAMNENSFLS